MVRPKKSTSASRTNGALAKNKGKAKTKVTVLTCSYDDSAGRYVVSTEERVQLPKGYVTYEAKVSAYRLCIQESAATPEGQSMSKPCSRAQWLQQSKEAEAKAVQMCLAHSPAGPLPLTQ